MMRNAKNNKMKVSGVMGQLYLQKKKTIFAFALIALMIFMWIRLLRGKSPQSAGAAAKKTESAAAMQSANNVKITFVTLPSMSGRHDVLHRDIFQMDSDAFGTDRRQNILIDGAGGIIERVVQMLRLEAIGMGSEPEAFINDKIVKVGQKVIVRDGGKQYECEVTKIQKNAVTVIVEGTEVELKLKEQPDFSEQ